MKKKHRLYKVYKFTYDDSRTVIDIYQYSTTTNSYMGAYTTDKEIDYVYFSNNSLDEHITNTCGVYEYLFSCDSLAHILQKYPELVMK